MRPTEKLGEICEILGGGTPSKNNKSYYENGNIPWASVRDMGGDIINETEFNITEEGLKNSSSNIIPQTGIVIATRVGLGKVCYLGQDTAINQDLKGIIPNKNIDKKYLFYYFKSISDFIISNGTGATVKGVSLNFIKELNIPLPPLETQKAIVAKLDQIFAKLDQTKSEIQKNLDNTDELRKSALNQAFQGDWEMKKIKDIADIKSGKRLPKGNFVQDKKTDYPYIRVSDFGDDGTITVSTVKYITEEIHEQIKKYIITDKDLYVSIAGTIGKTGIIPSELNGANLTENAVRLVYNGKYEIDNRFILYFTNSKSFEVQAGLASRAVAMPKLAISRLENIELPVPPLSEQEKIVEHLDQVSKEVKALKSQYQSQLDNLDELKKSVLDKAFRGELGE